MIPNGEIDMVTTQDIVNHYKFINSESLEILLELRNIVLETAPEATENIHSRGLIYFDGSRGGHVSAGICQILIFADHIRLSFIHGAFLPDPHHLLDAEKGRLVKRFVRLERYDNVPWEDLRDLVKASAGLDPRLCKID